MVPTETKSSISSKRKRLWSAVVVALVIVAAIAIVSGAFGDFTGGFRDGLTGKTRPDAGAAH